MLCYNYLECNLEEPTMKKCSDDANLGYADRCGEDSLSSLRAERFRQADALIDEEERSIPPEHRLRDLAD